MVWSALRLGRSSVGRVVGPTQYRDVLVVVVSMLKVSRLDSLLGENGELM